MAKFTKQREKFREFSQYAEIDRTRIDPRKFYRKTKRELQELVDEDGYRYSLTEDSDSTVRFDPTEICDRTGLVEGELSAASDWQTVYSDEETYSSSGLSTIIGIVLGAFGVFLGLAGIFIGDGAGIVVGLLALALIAVGVLAIYYSSTRTERTTYQYRRLVKVLVQGEATTAEVKTDSHTYPDLRSDISIIYAHDDRFRRVSNGESRMITRPELPEEVATQFKQESTSIIDELLEESDEIDWYVNRTLGEEVESTHQTTEETPSATPTT